MRIMKILLVDDEPIIRQGIRESIDWEAEGFEIIGDCPNGKEALGVLRSREVNIVLSDIRMPLMDGLELSGIIRSEFPDVAVVILTGFDDFEYAREALAHKVSHYILKPVGAEELIQVMGKVRDEMEVQFIKKREESRARGLVEENLNILQRDFLMELCRGETGFSEEGIRSKASSLHICLNGPLFQIYLLDIPCQSCDSGDLKTRLEEEYNESLACCSVDSRIMLVLRNRRSESKGGIPFSLSIQNIVRDKGENPPVVSFGPAVGALAQVPDSFVKSREAQSWKLYIGRGTVIPYTYGNRIQRSSDANPIPFSSLSDKLIHSIRTLKFDDLKSRITVLFQQFELEKAPAHIVENTILMLLNIMVLTALEQEIDLPRSRLADFVPIDKLHYPETLSEWKSLLFRRTGQIEEAILQIRKQSLCRITRDALKILDDSESLSVSLKETAVSMGISPNYLSKVFKEDMGESFVTYVNRLRIEKAAYLLSHSDLRVSEVADKLGFGDYKYFSSQFKKFKEISPGKFRNCPLPGGSVE